ncbi:MAG: hypothetical protein IKK08_02710 [Clostridia bacterium]|nr:hypothetical protein [Clostridia bacterium]
MKNKKPTQTAGGVPTPANVIRMRNPAAVQPPVDGDAPPPAKPVPLWQKWLRRLLLALLVAVALVLGYLFLLMGEPEETMDTAVVQPTLQPITIPMSPLDAPAGASLPSLADTFGQPVLGLRTGDITLSRARVFDTAFGGEYARRVTLTYLMPDGAELLVESIRPINAISLLGGEYNLQADRLYAMAGLDAARMQNSERICVFGQGAGAVYAITMPRTAEFQLETILKQTLLVTPPEQP